MAEDESKKHIVKNQHYVPRCYLTNFASTGDLYAFDRWEQKSFPANPESIAREKYFYDIGNTLDETSPNFQILERVLSDTESTFKSVRDEVIGKGEISKDNQQHLACFIALQHLRTPKMRVQICDYGRQVIQTIATKHLLQKGFDQDDIQFEVQFKGEGLKLIHLQTIFGSALSQALTGISEHLWVLGRNQSTVPLMTSDSPVVLFNEMDGGKYGVRSPGVQLVYPLSPDYLIWTQDRSKSTWDTRSHLSCIDLGHMEIGKFNDLQILNSHRFVFYSHDNFQSISSLCDRFPELKKPPANQLELVENVSTGEVTFRPKR